MTSKRTFGRHYLVDLHDCDPEKIKYVDPVRIAALKAGHECRATLLGNQFHQFEPMGVSGVILIAESHISLHTWPEAGFVSLDIFTCGEEMEPAIAVDALAREFGASEIQMQVVERGRIGE